MLTYKLGEQEVLLIINTFTGSVLKIKNPRQHHVTKPIAYLIREEGACTPDQLICRIVVYGHEVTKKLNKPTSEEGMALYDKITDFILLADLKHD